MTLRDTLDNILRRGSQTISNIPILGGFTRAMRYPMEFQRQVGGIGEYGTQALLGADDDRLADIYARHQEPVFMNPDEFRKMTGQDSMYSPLIEGGAAGADLMRWMLPGGQIDSAIRSQVNVGGKALPWLAGKVGEGALRGLLTGGATVDADTPGDIPGRLIRGAGLGAGLNVAVGGAMEGIGKGLEKIGTRTRARSLGLSKKGETTGQIADRLGRVKDKEGLALTAQGQIDRSAERINDLTQKKVDALTSATDNPSDIGLSALTKFQKTIEKSGKASQLKNSQDYENVIDAVANAKSLADLDDLAIQYRDYVTTASGAYDPDSTVMKEVYDKAANAIVSSLKKIDGYKTAKEGLQQLMSDERGREILNRAFSEQQGISSFPLSSGEMPIPKGLFSAIGGIVGGAERGIGNFLQSPFIQQLATMGGTEAALGTSDPSGITRTGRLQDTPRESIDSGRVDQVMNESIPTSDLFSSDRAPSGDDAFEEIMRRNFGGGQEPSGGPMGEGGYQQQSALMTLLFAQQGMSLGEASTLSSLILASQGILPESEAKGMSNEEIGIATAESMVDEIEELLGRIDLFEGDVAASIFGRGKELYGKTVKSSDVGQYMRFREGISSRLSRALGEVGVLTDEDVRRAVELLPTPQDTPESARENLERLRRMLKNTRELYASRNPSQQTQGTGDMSALYQLLHGAQ